MRNKLPNAGLLDQLIIITIKKELTDHSDMPPIESFLYAVSIADGIQIQVQSSTIKYCVLVHKFIKMAARVLAMQDFPFIDIICKLTKYS